MTLRIFAVLVAALSLVSVLVPSGSHAQPASAPAGAPPVSPVGVPVLEERPRVQTVIERHLGRPYVWGATGLKSFDCSGFVWRVMQENGIFVKRTTARKYFLTLPKVSEDQRWAFGNIVFFSDLKHCGIVQTPETFYHAAVSVGTHVSRFDPFWRRRVTGVRAIPGLTDALATGKPAN